MLPKRSYYDSSIFDEEVRQIFATGYQFVGMTTELQNDRDFVCIDHHGASIVVQNFKGEIRAFQNICTHRFNRIQTETRGNRPLMCTYHGWSFDKNGAPAGMPKREEFAEFDNAQLCLPQYPVETCGKFVFINRGGGAPSLREHLGEFYQMLEEMSEYFGPDVNFCDVPNVANWKLLVENVMECYHCYTAHGETFIPWGVGKLPMVDARFDRGHSSAYYPRLDKPREELRQRYLSHLASRKFNHNSFFHIYIFPNLFISSSQGLSFYVGHLLPVAVDRTIQRVRHFEPNVELSPKHRARQDPINESSVEVGMKLIEEDREILEKIQRSIAIADRPGALATYEELRVRKFLDHYHAMMAGGPLEMAAE